MRRRMRISRNGFKQALKEGRPQIGFWQSMASTSAAELCAGAGFDWLMFDGEHAPNDVPTLLAQLQAVAAYPVHSVGRPPSGEIWLIKQYLDIGFQTLLIPMVDTAEHAERLAWAMRYPPDGGRGVGAGSSRAGRWGQIEGYIRDADKEMCLLVQVETKLAIDNLESIAAVAGVDGIFIGPSDLSASFGRPGEPDHPEVRAVIRDAIARILKADKAPGILASDEARAREYLDLGAVFVAVGTDVGLLARQAAALAGRFKGASGPPALRGNSY